MHQLVSTTSVATTPEITPEVAGLTDWAQRNILYTHTQDILSDVWTIPHGLVGDPQILCYGIRQASTYEYYVPILPISVKHDYINRISTVTFDSSEYGTAQCITNTTTQTTTSASLTSTVELGNDSGIVTIGTLNVSDYVSITLRCLTTTNSYLDIVCASVGIGPAVSSAWSDMQYVQLNGKRYAARSFDLAATISPQVKAGVIVEGSAIYLSQLNNANIGSGDVVFLMSKTPHNTTDKIKRSYVDAYSISASLPETFLKSSTLYTKNTVIRTTYPPIIKTT